MMQRKVFTSTSRCMLQLLSFLTAVVISAPADAGPRKVQKQAELDYHQPIVKPASNKHHKGAAGGAGTAAATGPCSNPVACENQLTGNPPSEWQLLEPGDASIQGFATEPSVNVGGTVHFKVFASVTYRIDIYRVGWYQGNGARKITTIANIAPRTQPACRVDTTNTTGLIDCGNWAETASWAVPANAVSGVYFARLVDLILENAPIAGQRVIESDMSDVLCEMALAGRGVAWLTEGTAAAHGHKGLAAIGGNKWALPLSLVAFKDRTNSQRSLNLFWSELCRNNAAHAADGRAGQVAKGPVKSPARPSRSSR